MVVGEKQNTNLWIIQMFHFTESGFVHSIPTVYCRYTYKEGNKLIFLHSIFILFESYGKVGCV